MNSNGLDARIVFLDTDTAVPKGLSHSSSGCFYPRYGCDLSMRLQRGRTCVALLLLVMCSLSGCSLVRNSLATLQSTADFIALDADRRILYEDGSKEFALEVAGYLPDAIAKVEKEQYRPFPKPVEVYVCAMKKSFSRYTGQPKIVKGAVTIKHLFLSAERLSELPLDIRQAVLVHELSHLHLQQYLGVYTSNVNIPEWFQEGLAEYVSGGAAMYDVSEVEAAMAILEGHRITPETKGHFFFPKRWGAYDLSPHMFYRQAWMFISYLHRADEKGFRALLLAVESGKEFDRSFSDAYRIDLSEAWQMFVETAVKHIP